MKKNIWPGPEVNSFFLPRRLYLPYVYARFLFVAPLYIFVFDYMAVFDLLCCVPSHCHYKLKSPSDKLFRFHTWICYTPETCVVPHMQGGMFLVCNWGDSWQLCDPESTFERQLKHKQAPKPAGIAHLLLQTIKQTKRGQRWCKTTIVYLGGLCSLLERQQVCQWAVEGTLLVPALCTGAELCSGVRGFFVGPTIAPARMCSPSSCTSALCFGGYVHLVAGIENAAAETLWAQQSLHLLPFFWFCTLMS